MFHAGKGLRGHYARLCTGLSTQSVDNFLKTIRVVDNGADCDGKPIIPDSWDKRGQNCTTALFSKNRVRPELLPSWSEKWKCATRWKKSKIGLFFPNQNIATSMATRFPAGGRRPTMSSTLSATTAGKRCTNQNRTTTINGTHSRQETDHPQFLAKR